MAVKAIFGSKVNLSELNQIRKLKHKNIVEIFDVIKHQEKFYLISEFLEFGSLESYLKQVGNLSEE